MSGVFGAVDVGSDSDDGDDYSVYDDCSVNDGVSGQSRLCV